MQPSYLWNYLCDISDVALLLSPDILNNVLLG